MNKKQDFYHGVALIQLLDNSNCQSVHKFENGYLVNNRILFFLKYTTKNRSPWIFVFNPDEIIKMNQFLEVCEKIYLSFVCAGDGVCVADWRKIRALFDDASQGWISINRGFKKWFLLKGPKGDLEGKIPLKSWPKLMFE